MTVMPMGIDFSDIAPIITQAVDSAGNIVTKVIDSRTGKAVAPAGNYQAGSTGAGIMQYAPWVAGGVAGLLLLLFVMRR